MNNVNLIGRIATEIELRYTPQGTAVADFALAVDGYKDDTYFFDITVWGNTAENTAEYMEKGREVGISGELRQDKWKNDQGQKRSKVKVNASNVKFLSGRDNTNQQKQSSQQKQKQQSDDADLEVPF